MHTHEIRLLTALALTVVVAQAQNAAPRGATRLESGSLRLMHGPTAVYPEAARKTGIEGKVVVEAMLDASGHVIDAHVVSGATELRAAALRSILDDHFASDGSASRAVQLSVVFSLQGGAAPVAPARDFGNPPPPIASIDCTLLPPDLCRDGRQRLASSVGSPLTTEKMADMQKEVAALDDHLVLNTRRIANGVVLDIWLKTSPDMQVGVVGGVASGSFSGGGGIGPPPPPPPPQRQERPSVSRISTGALQQQAKLKRRVNPVYPPEAKDARIQGAVVFSAVIAKDGTVQNIKVLSGQPLLVDAATEAVRKWEYQPTLINGEPVEVVTTITLNFTLQQ